MNTFRTIARTRIAPALIVVATLSAVSFPSFARQDNNGLTGGGSCSVWQKIKSAVSGVYCGYL